MQAAPMQHAPMQSAQASPMQSAPMRAAPMQGAVAAPMQPVPMPPPPAPAQAAPMQTAPMQNIPMQAAPMEAAAPAAAAAMHPEPPPPMHSSVKAVPPPRAASSPPPPRVPPPPPPPPPPPAPSKPRSVLDALQAVLGESFVKAAPTPSPVQDASHPADPVQGSPSSAVADEARAWEPPATQVTAPEHSVATMAAGDMHKASSSVPQNLPFAASKAALQGRAPASSHDDVRSPPQPGVPPSPGPCYVHGPAGCGAAPGPPASEYMYDAPTPAQSSSAGWQQMHNGRPTHNGDAMAPGYCGTMQGSPPPPPPPVADRGPLDPAYMDRLLFKAQQAGLSLSNEALTALSGLPPLDAAELLEHVLEKSQELRDPSNYIVSTVARGFQSRRANRSFPGGPGPQAAAAFNHQQMGDQCKGKGKGGFGVDMSSLAAPPQGPDLKRQRMW
eukprot:TRINITY_DN26913_c0_g1_i1.p1 TRINITY_DN26913_c0_g1~~TRINITY_DN26913_c0_g1_i1.p1  ORF type:complete len:479 (+),score=123.46 TRINITY_DN26913_c0_g1_i1:110-1438(+)